MDVTVRELQHLPGLPDELVANGELKAGGSLEPGRQVRINVGSLRGRLVARSGELLASWQANLQDVLVLPLADIDWGEAAGDAELRFTAAVAQIVHSSVRARYFMAASP